MGVKRRAESGDGARRSKQRGGGGGGGVRRAHWNAHNGSAKLLGKVKHHKCATPLFPNLSLDQISDAQCVLALSRSTKGAHVDVIEPLVLGPHQLDQPDSAGALVAGGEGALFWRAPPPPPLPPPPCWDGDGAAASCSRASIVGAAGGEEERRRARQSGSRLFTPDESRPLHELHELQPRRQWHQRTGPSRWPRTTRPHYTTSPYTRTSGP
jgi:hypothetical protein